MKPKNYLTICLISALTIGTLVAWLNWFVDPFSFFGRNLFGAYHVYEEKLQKTRMIKMKTYDAAIFGSSRAVTLDTKFTEKWGLDTFNASFVGTYPEEILFFVQNHLTNVKTVIIGLDYYMFNSRCQDIIKPNFGIYSLDQLEKYAISYYALKYSVSTLKKYFKKHPVVISTSGNRNMDSQEALDAAATTTDYTKILEFWEARSTCGYQFSDERLKITQKIYKFLTVSGHKVHLFMQPISTILHKVILEHGQGSEFDEWRRKMKKNFPEIRDLSTTPFSDPEYFYWNDPVHYTKATGGKILEFLLREKPAGGNSN